MKRWPNPQSADPEALSSLHGAAVARGAAAERCTSPMMRTVFLVLLVALTVAGAEQARSKDEDDVREVAFKSLINETAAAQQGYRVYFFSVGLKWTDDNHFTYKDPSDEFMKRFAGRKPPVRKVSDSRKADGGRVEERSTGQPGVIFMIDNLRWTSDNGAEASCSVYKSGLNGFALKYTLSRTNNQWKVTSRSLVSVS